MLSDKKNGNKNMLQELTVSIDGRKYRLNVKQQVKRKLSVPRVIIPAYMPNETARSILQTCIQSIQAQTNPEEYELWVVDNCSPATFLTWLMEWPGINVISSRTVPLPAEQRSLFAKLAFWKTQKDWGSYANAVALEIATCVIEQNSKYILTLHMDTMVCRGNWIQTLQGMLTDRVRAAGVCMEHVRFPQGVLHVLGYLVDFQMMKKLGVDFFPALPEIDVGDNVTLLFRQVGLEVISLDNTYEKKELADNISAESPFKNFNVLRAFDLQGNIIFMHLGRGIRKSDNSYIGDSAAAEEWLAFYRKHIENLHKGAIKSAVF